MSTRQKILSLIILFSLFFCLDLLLPRDLWVQDEARYGEVVREMVEDGRVIVPYLNGHPYPDKPPGYFALLIVAAQWISPPELAFRWLTIFFTAIAALGVFRLGEALGDRNLGLSATMLFLTMFSTLLVGHIVRMDMPLTAITLWSGRWLVCFFQTRKAYGLWLFWTLMLLAMAIKGPIALLFTLLPALIWASWEKGFSAMIREIALVKGMLFLLLAAALWIILVLSLGEGSYLTQIWQQQLLGRAVKDWSHPEPFYFYLLVLPFLAIPWSGLIALGGYRLFQEKLPALRWIVAFTLPPFLALSLISGKLVVYVQPIVPWLALAGAIGLHHFLKEGKNYRWLYWLQWGESLIILIALTVGLMLFHLYVGLDPVWQWGMGGALALLMLISMVATYCRGYGFIGSWLLYIGILNVLIFAALMTLMNPWFSARSLGESVIQQVDSHQPVAVVGTTRGILNYYAKRTFTELSPQEVVDWWRQHPHGALIIKQADIRKLSELKVKIAHCQIHHHFLIESWIPSPKYEYHLLNRCPTP